MDKKIGYLLLLGGVAILVFSAALTVLTLYGGMQPPQLFRTDSALTVNTSIGGGMNVPLPPHINIAANLGVFFAAIFLLAVIGSRIGRLGVRLIHGPKPDKEAAAK